jgi:ribonuclease HII
MKKIKHKTNINFEKTAWSTSSYVCGIDEAGRGCLFGPLVTSAAIVPQNTKERFLKDSKVMSEKERLFAYEWIKKNCFFSTVLVDPLTIEKQNIYKATQNAMKKSFIQLVEIVPFALQKIKYVITDAMPLKLDDIYKHETLELFNPTHAESISCSVAAASIVAKVTRDLLVKKLSKSFPQFELERHKGYGTKIHINKIEKHGISILHRKSFIKNHEQQKTIF